MVEFLAACVVAGTPLVFATVGELITEKSGSMNLGVEGMMLMGAVMGFLASINTYNPAVALLAAALAGAGGALIFGFLTVSLRDSSDGVHPASRPAVRSCRSHRNQPLQTADAISAIFELITAINTDVRNGASKEFAEKCLDILMELASVVGLLQKEEDDSVDEDIQALVDERQEARKAKNFARADEIRDLLKAKGITLKDTPQGVQIIKE